MYYGVTAFLGNSEQKIGNGKTLFLVKNLKLAFNEGKTIYTNMDLKFGNKSKKQIKTIDNGFFDILTVKNAVVGIDELTAFVGTAYTGIKTELKDDIVRFFGQQRKRKIPVYYTNQIFFNAPSFVRRYTSRLFTSYKLEKYPLPQLKHIENYTCLDEDCDQEHIFYCEGFDSGGLMLTPDLIVEPDYYYNLYDTYEIIEPIKYRIKNKQGKVVERGVI